MSGKLHKMLRDWCKADDANLDRILHVVTDQDNMDCGYEDMEEIFVAAFGERVRCPCGSGVFPGHLCWGCEDWVAPLKGEQ